METRHEWRKKNPHWLFIKPNAAMVELSKLEGKRRNDEAALYGRRSRSLSEDGAHLNAIGRLCEHGVAHVLGTQARAAVLRTKAEMALGDLLSGEEIKSCSSPYPSGWRLILNQDQLHLDRVYVNCLSCLYPERIIVQGFASGETIQRHAHPCVSRYGHAILLLDPKHLSPVKFLVEKRDLQTAPPGARCSETNEGYTA